MFRRRRTPSVGRGTTTPSASAQTAATQAFLSHQASTASLSSAAAAAAAALRTHTSSPTPVGDIQTRRMLQRQSSNSSNGSAAKPPSRGRGMGLQRQNSSGSMTDRTFRDPSPSRPVSRGAVDRPPPVPPVPDSYYTENFPPPPKSHRRVVSMEPLPRVMSPTPNTPGGRGVSLDRKPGQPPGRPPGQKAKQRLPSLESVQELHRTDSRNSINFSLPTHARPNSPTPPASPISPVSDPKSAKRPVSTPVPPKPAQVMSPAETANVQYSVTEAANKPVKKKKKVVARGIGEGSHLASGAAGGKPTGTAVDISPAHAAAMAAPALRAKEEAVASSQSTDETPKKPKKKKSKPKVAEPQSQEYQPGHNRYGSESDSASERESQTFVRPQAARTSGQLQKQPSIVHEDWEGEEGAELNQGTPQKMTAPATEITSSPVEPASRPKKKRPATANTFKKTMEPSPQPPAVTQPQPLPTLIATLPSPEIPPPVTNNHLSAKTNGNGQVPRPQSLSPSRQAHFSSYVSIGGAPNEPKHQPPPRSVSPAKSAMKHHSPSPQALSLVDVMPGSWNRGGPPSEASDATSTVSDEGSKGTPKKKKSVRVSFDDDAVVVGAAASQLSKAPEPPVQEQDEAKSKEPAKRSWLGSNRGKVPQTSDDLDDGIKPMPALPSFGSIRQRKTASDNSTPLSSGETSSAASSISNQPTQDTSLSVSSDQVVGGILAQDFASKAEKQPAKHVVSNEPLPPEVTSVEGTGYGSDTDGTEGSIYSVEKESEGIDKTPVPNDIHVSEDHATPYRELASPVPDSDHETIPLWQQEVESVPSIAVHPATPSAEHRDHMGGLLDMPGGFPVPTETLEKASATSETSTAPTPAAVTPATSGIAEPTPPEAATHQDPSTPAVGAVAQGLDIQTGQGIQTETEEDTESDDTGNSIYSDAAEDASEFEGDGFGSINAIVESPVVSPIVQSPSLPTSSPPDSPAARSAPARGGPKGISDPISQEGWDKAQTHWSNINQSRKEGKQAAQQPPTTSAAQSVPLELFAPKPKPKKKKKTVPVNADKSLLSTQAARLAPESSRLAPKSSLKQPAPSTMRRSMRSEPVVEEEEPTHMRQPMRSGGAMRGSMRGPPPPQQNQRQNQQRHSLGSAPVPEPRGTLQKRNLRPVSEIAPPKQPKQRAASKPSAAAAAPLPSAQPAPKKVPLGRRFSNDSDSSSSFKKSRPVKPSGERYTMQRSMRSASTPSQPSSPVQQRFPQMKRDSSAGGRPMSATGGMRSTMRGSIDSTGPSLRNKERPTSPSSFNFGRKPKEKAKPAKSPARFKSRFGDSSDEDDGPKVFRSRYADSSDDEPEDLPRNLRPVRGIPRKEDEGDSTDLEDSSDEEAAPQPTQPKTSSPKAGAKKGTALATGSLRRSGSGRDLSKTADAEADPKKKKGIFGRFRSKKDKSKVEKTGFAPTMRQSAPPTNANVVDGDLAPLPKPPKLTRRVTPKRLNSESWPLPDKEVEVNKRPSTSDGVVLGTDVRFGAGVDAGAGTSNGRARTNTDSTANTEKGNNAMIGRGVKKKRFPMLRKAFGLND